MEVQAFHAGLPGYAATPLTEVPALAAELGVGPVFVKDESARMGLPAFKVLGASWAVYQVLSRRPAAGALTLVTATDGNHGRAVARMARLFAQRAHVFVPGGVHPRRWRPLRRRERGSPRSPVRTTRRFGSRLTRPPPGPPGRARVGVPSSGMIWASRAGRPPEGPVRSEEPSLRAGPGGCGRSRLRMRPVRVRR